MNKIKSFLILFIVFFAWVMLYLFFVNQEKDSKLSSEPQYILINPFSCWEYRSSEWRRLSFLNNKTEVSKLINWKKYDIYVNNQYYNTLQYVVKNGEEFYFDDDTHSYEINNNKIMFNKGSYFKIKNFSLSNLLSDDKKAINTMLKKYNFLNKNITVSNKYYIDENNSIYVVSNYTGIYSVDSNDLFYLVFYKNKHKTYLLLNTGYKENVSDYKLSWIIDTKSKFYNFIISAQCEQSMCYWLYGYQKGKYVELG